MDKYVERQKPIKVIQFNKYNVARIARVFDEDTIEIYYNNIDKLSATADTLFCGITPISEGDYLIVSDDEKYIEMVKKQEEFEQKYMYAILQEG